MEKEEEVAEVESESDSYEFVCDKDARGSMQQDSNEGTDIISGKVEERGSSHSGVTNLSRTETFLAKRVRDLQQDNDELKKVINDYQETLQLCERNLHTWKDQQRDSHNDLLKKHNQAKTTVSKLQSDIANLKQQLDNKNKCLQDSENRIAQQSNQESEKQKCLLKENVSLMSVKNALETNVGYLKEHIAKLGNLPDEDHQKSGTSGRTISEDLVKICNKLVVTVKAAVPSIGDDPLQEELQSAKTKCSMLEKELEQEKVKRLDLEKQNKEQQKFIQSNLGASIHHNSQGADVKDVQEEVQLLKMDMEKLDLVTAGCVSHDSQATNDSLMNLQKQRPYESVESSESLAFEEERRALTKKIEKLESHKQTMDKREVEQIKKREELLSRNKQLEELLRRLEEEKPHYEEQIQAILAENKLLKDEKEEKEEKENINLLHELAEQQKEQEMSKQLLVEKHHEIEGLKRQVFSLCQEVNEKERLTEQWKAQELELKQRLKHMEMRYMEINSAFNETRNELSSVYAENETLLAKNQARQGVSGAEVAEYKSKIDNLTAQLLSAEEMVENKEQDYRKLQQDHANLTSEMETVPLLKQQIEVFQTDFATERQTRQKREEDCKRLREEIAKLRNENERLTEEVNSQSGSKMAELQRRHGAGINSSEQSSNPWTGFYDRFLAPRGPPARGGSAQQSLDSDLNRQVSGGRCPKCDRMFPDLDALQIHVVECLESENTSSAGERVCPKCQESFPDLDTLQIHVMECLDN